MVDYQCFLRSFCISPSYRTQHDGKTTTTKNNSKKPFGNRIGYCLYLIGTQPGLHAPHPAHRKKKEGRKTKIKQNPARYWPTTNLSEYNVSEYCAPFQNPRLPAQHALPAPHEASGELLRPTPSTAAPGTSTNTQRTPPHPPGTPTQARGAPQPTHQGVPRPRERSASPATGAARAPEHPQEPHLEHLPRCSSRSIPAPHTCELWLGAQLSPGHGRPGRETTARQPSPPALRVPTAPDPRADRSGHLGPRLHPNSAPLGWTRSCASCRPTKRCPAPPLPALRPRPGAPRPASVRPGARTLSRLLPKDVGSWSTRAAKRTPRTLQGGEGLSGRRGGVGRVPPGAILFGEVSGMGIPREPRAGASE